MKPYLLGLFVASIMCAGEFTVSEWNMMYHFEDLDKQFPYVDSKDLDHSGRIGDTIRILGEMKADASCFLEWNGNEKNPFYIDSAKTLIAKFKERVAAGLQEAGYPAELKTLLQDIQKLLQGEENKINFSSIEKKAREKLAKPGTITDDTHKAFLRELAARSETIPLVKGLYLFEDANYIRHIVQKKWGQIYNADGHDSSEEKKKLTAKPPEAKSPSSPMQSILVAINKAKFDEVEPGKFEVFTDEPDKDKEPNSQNFVVKRLKVKGTATEVTLICTHMKSKKSFYPNRRKLCRSIRAYIQKEKLAKPNANFILMGDMNTEIDEMAENLNINIVRLEQQTTLPFTSFEPRTVFMPRSHLPDLLERQEEERKKRDEFSKHLTTEKGKADESLKLADLDKTLAELTANIAEVNKVEGENDNMLWIEMANFMTEKKIRVAEIDYKDKEYQSYLKAYYQANPTIKANVEAAIAAMKKKQDEKANAAAVGKFRQAEIDQQERDAETFRLTVNEIKAAIAKKGNIRTIKDFFVSSEKNYVEWKQDPNRKWGPDDKPLEFYVMLLIESLLLEEKIDFLLLHPANRFKLHETKSVSSYFPDIKIGIPNAGIGSDHFPTWVKLEFAAEKFDSKAYLGAQVPTLTLVKRDNGDPAAKKFRVVV